MNPNDDKLKQLLGQWREIEPRAQFEADVLRRIRQTAPQRQGWLERFGLQPIWVQAVAMLAGITIGLYAGLSPTPTTQDAALLKPGTLTGNYVSMIAGGSP
jgi:hypothetical protein